MRPGQAAEPDRHSGTRSLRAATKLARMAKALRHEQPDRVPISDFFWGAFVERWRRELGLPDDATPYTHYDLDWIVTVPILDPWIRPFETLRESPDEVLVKTGFGATVRKRFAYPMPEMQAWDIDTFGKLQEAAFDAPDDRRRFDEGGGNHLTGAADGYQPFAPPWIDTVRRLRPDFPVYGSVIEVSECLTRLIGQANAMLWVGMHPEAMGRVIRRIGDFYVACARAQLEAARGLLDGFVIWGDVAYARGTFVSPDYWRTYFKPCVAGITSLAHDHGLPVIYHGCGDVRAIFEDFIDMGVDAYNPLEAKAGMDVVELRKAYGHRIAFCGGSDVQVWESGDLDRIRREVDYRLQVARGGGYIFQSDHSVTSSVSGRTYDYIVKRVREHGTEADRRVPR